MTVGLHTKTLIVKDYEELREKISSSGVFEMTDCAVEILCPEGAMTEELDRMRNLLESVIHVTDIKIGSDVESFHEETYKIIFVEDNRHTKRNFVRER